MSKASSLILALSLGSGIFLSGCTLDAQLASSLLDSLKSQIEDNTDENGQVKLTAKDLSDATEAANVKVVCGGKDMTIASLDDDEDEAEDEDEVIEAADFVHPVMLGYGPGGRRGGQVQRIQIDINLAQELSRLPRYAGAEREQQYRKIQQAYPQMRKARPIPLKGGSSKEIVFGDFCGCSDEHGTATHGTGSGSAPARAPMPANYGGQPGYGQTVAYGHYGQSGSHYGPPMPGQFMQPGRRVSYAMPAMPAEAGAAPVPGKRFAWAGMPIEGFKNAKGQPCELLSRSDDANESDESDDNSSDSDNDEDED